MAAPPLPLPQLYQFGRTEPQILGPGPNGTAAELSALWFGRLAMRRARPVHRLEDRRSPSPLVRDHQQHPLAHPALGPGAALGQSRVEPSHTAAWPGLALQIRAPFASGG